MYIYVGAKPFALRNFAHVYAGGSRASFIKGNKFIHSNNSISEEEEIEERSTLIHEEEEGGGEKRKRKCKHMARHTTPR